MKNSGYVAVGHVLGMKDAKDHVKTLRHFCAVIFCNMDEDMVNKSHGFGLYDKFMSSTSASVESFAKLLDGMLKRHGVDDLEFQLKVNRITNVVDFETYVNYVEQYMQYDVMVGHFI
jgi:hypothetical protein